MKGSAFIRPYKVRLEAATACQLKCPSCPTASGDTGRHLGTGFLKFADFKALLDNNPWITSVELSNWGEIFLNPELIRILKYAHQQHVTVQAINGANLNHMDEALCEALVKYRFLVLTCSLDGATPESYQTYRVQGDFDRVIANIKKINEYKQRYRSRHPLLIWQFVAFGHNEHEINQARALARDLDMGFKLKLSWGDLYLDDFSPVQDQETVRRESGLDVSTRAEYADKYHRHYMRECCLEMWSEPQINYDGRLLGCPINFWGDYGNAFSAGLMETLQGEKMTYARAMLMGQRPPRDDIPCCACNNFQCLLERNDWIQEQDLKKRNALGRLVLALQQTPRCGPAITKRILNLYRHRK